MTKKTQRVVEFVLRSSWFLCWGVVGLFTTSLGFTGCTYSPTYSSALQSRGGVGSTFEKPSAKRHAAGAATANKRTETTLSVDEAIVVATRDNRALADLRARAPMQQAEIELADQWEDPELRISEISIDDMLDGEPTLELALRIPFQRPGSLSVKRTLSALSYAHLNARIRSAEHKLAVDIRRLYFHLAMVELDLQEVAQEITAREKHVDLVRRRVRAGVMPRLGSPRPEKARRLAATEAHTAKVAGLAPRPRIELGWQAARQIVVPEAAVRETSRGGLGQRGSIS